MFFCLYILIGLCFGAWILWDGRQKGYGRKPMLFHGLLGAMLHPYILFYLLISRRRKATRPKGRMGNCLSRPFVPLALLALFTAGRVIQCLWFYNSLLLPDEAAVRRMVESDSAVRYLDTAVIQSDGWYKGEDTFLRELDSLYKTVGYKGPDGKSAVCIAFADAGSKGGAILFPPDDPKRAEESSRLIARGKNSRQSRTPWHFFGVSGWESFYILDNIVGTRVDIWYRGGRRFMLLTRIENTEAYLEDEDFRRKLVKSLEGK